MQIKFLKEKVKLFFFFWGGGILLGGLTYSPPKYLKTFPGHIRSFTAKENHIGSAVSEIHNVYNRIDQLRCKIRQFSEIFTKSSLLIIDLFVHPTITMYGK